MTIRLTLKCSLNCKHCLVNALPTSNNISEETFNNLLNLLKYINVPILNISGGEFTEIENFEYLIYKLINFIKLNNLKTKLLLQSNGTFIFNEDKINIIMNLIKNPVIYKLYISTNKTWYKDYDKIYEYFKNIKNDKICLYLYDRSEVLKNLGRAKNLTDVNLDTLASCKLPYDIIKQGNHKNLKDIFNILPAGNCSPMINIDGNMYLGWAPECVCVGNINKDSYEEIYKNILNYSPCKKCKQII